MSSVSNTISLEIPGKPLENLEQQFKALNLFQSFAQLKAKEKLSTTLYSFISIVLRDESLQLAFDRQLEEAANIFIMSLSESKRAQVLEDMDSHISSPINIVNSKLNVEFGNIDSRRLACEVDHEMSGNPIIFSTLANGVYIYTGDTLCGVPEGKGSLKMRDRTIVGTFINGMAASGTIVWDDFSLYTGNIKDDNMYGIGIYSCSKYVIEARWNGHLNCEGQYIGLKYLGEYTGDLWTGSLTSKTPFRRTGMGVYTYANGNTLEGEWIYGTIFRGTFKRPDGTFYIGDFCTGGHGNIPSFTNCIVSWPDGSVITCAAPRGQVPQLHLFSANGDSNRITEAAAIELLGFKIPANI